MTKVINELTEQGYILPLKDIYTKNKYKSKKWILSNKALKLAKDTDGKQKQAKATSNKINIPTQVNNNNLSKGGINNANNTKETAPQPHVPTLAELQAAIMI